MCRLEEQQSKIKVTTNKNPSPLLSRRPSTCSILSRRSSPCSVLSTFQDKCRVEGNKQLSRSSSCVSIDLELFLLDMGSKSSKIAFRPTSAMTYDRRRDRKPSGFGRRSSLPILQNNFIGNKTRNDLEDTNQKSCKCGTNPGSLNGQQLSSFFNLWSRKDAGNRILGRQDPVWTRSSIYRSCGCHTGEYINNEKIMAKKQLKCCCH